MNPRENKTTIEVKALRFILFIFPPVSRRNGEGKQADERDDKEEKNGGVCYRMQGVVAFHERMPQRTRLTVTVELD